MRIALHVEYDGAGFCGWQTQPAGCGVQDALERALAAVATAPVATVCAGRTDAGVHALMQVVHFDPPAERPLSAWVRGVNAHLPDGVAVLDARPVETGFDARGSALERCYRYRLLNHPVRPALDLRRCGWEHAPLDVDAMRAAARLVLGRHDFSAFRAAECQAKTPVRELRRVDIERDGCWIEFGLAADAYLHHMVRNLVGALLSVGRGRHPVPWIGELLASRDRSRGAPTAPAGGLYLAEVRYPELHRLDFRPRPMPVREWR
jgi:tRNA pseudouridine38-40 synthase